MTAHPDLRKLALDLLVTGRVKHSDQYCGNVYDLADALGNALTAAVCERIAAGLEEEAAAEYTRSCASTVAEVKAVFADRANALLDAAPRVRAGEWTAES